eukprot:COSAG04_NODE_2358_length_4284_cov_1.855159_2_plen_718_part_00
MFPKKTSGTDARQKKFQRWLRAVVGEHSLSHPRVAAFLEVQLPAGPPPQPPPQMQMQMQPQSVAMRGHGAGAAAAARPSGGTVDPAVRYGHQLQQQQQQRQQQHPHQHHRRQQQQQPLGLATTDQRSLPPAPVPEPEPEPEPETETETETEAEMEAAEIAAQMRARLGAHSTELRSEALEAEPEPEPQPAVQHTQADDEPLFETPRPRLPARPAAEPPGPDSSALREKLQEFFAGVPIGSPGGRGSTSERSFDISEILRFAEQAGLHSETPEEIYRQFVEMQMSAAEPVSPTGSSAEAQAAADAAPGAAPEPEPEPGPEPEIDAVQLSRIEVENWGKWTSKDGGKDHVVWTINVVPQNHQPRSLQMRFSDVETFHNTLMNDPHNLRLPPEWQFQGKLPGTWWFGGAFDAAKLNERRKQFEAYFAALVDWDHHMRRPGGLKTLSARTPGSTTRTIATPLQWSPVKAFLEVDDWVPINRRAEDERDGNEPEPEPQMEMEAAQVVAQMRARGLGANNTERRSEALEAEPEPEPEPAVQHRHAGGVQPPPPPSGFEGPPAEDGTRFLLGQQCKVYSKSSSSWCEAVVIAVDNTNATVQVQYRTASGAIMQKVLEADSRGLSVPKPPRERPAVSEQPEPEPEPEPESQRGLRSRSRSRSRSLRSRRSCLRCRQSRPRVIPAVRTVLSAAILLKMLEESTIMNGRRWLRDRWQQTSAAENGSL